MKKRLVALLMAAVMALSLSACGSDGESAGDDAAKTDGQKDSASDGDDETEKIPLKISHHPYLHGLPSIYAE